MEVIEEASNMLLIQGEDGLMQKANNARTRLKYGAGELDPIPELFDADFSDGPFEFGDDVYVYPTRNDSVFVTMFQDKPDELPLAVQNPAGDTLTFLSGLEDYLQTNDLDKFKESFNKGVSVKDNHSGSEEGGVIRRPLMEGWFSGVPDFTVTDNGLKITEDLFLYWEGEAVKSGIQPRQLITEFEPMVDFMYRPEVKPRWNQKFELTETELYIIQRATRLYDRLISLESSDDFDTMTVRLFRDS